MFCQIHDTELNFKTKTKGVPYHWIEEGKSGFDNMCYGDKDSQNPPPQREKLNKPEGQAGAAENTGAGSSDPDKMSKQEWAEKDMRYYRSQLANTALRELLIHSSGKIKHQETLDNLLYWVWHGKWKTPIEARKEGSEDEEDPFID